MRILLIGVLASLGLAACAGAPPKPAALAVAVPAPLDPSYDWHVLLAAPMGTLLKDMPVTLHEVLLFRDEEKRGEANEGDCYAIDATAPSFLARVPDEYLLCFKHDRLARVEATVHVPQDGAAKIFADACALWFKNAALPAPLIGTATESAPAACAGQDRAVAFNGRLEAQADPADAPVSISIDALEQR